MFPSPQIVEMLGIAGFDWVLIDCEHGSIGPGRRRADGDGLRRASASLRSRGPKTNAASDIQGVMDRGVMGVQVPHINTAEERAPRRGGGQVRPGRRARAGGRHPPRSAGALGGACRTSRKPPTPSRSCACSSSTSVRCDNIDDHPRGGGHRRVLHRPVGPVAVDGPSRQSQGAAGRAARSRRACSRSSPPAARPAHARQRPKRLPQVQEPAAADTSTHLPRLAGAGATRLPCSAGVDDAS